MGRASLQPANRKKRCRYVVPTALAEGWGVLCNELQTSRHAGVLVMQVVLLANVWSHRPQNVGTIEPPVVAMPASPEIREPSHREIFVEHWLAKDDDDNTLQLLHKFIRKDVADGRTCMAEAEVGFYV